MLAGHRDVAWAAAAAALLACALYAVTLWGGYAYDDAYVLQNDARVQRPGGWAGYFREPYLIGAPDPLWRPLTGLTYWLQWQLHGDRPWAFHLVNILLHAIVSAMAAVLAWRWTRSLAACWWAGLLFAAHPLHVEAVAYLVGRAESLCTLGVVGGLLLFARRPWTNARVAAIVGCFAIAAFSKEHGLLLPPMILIHYVVMRWRGGAAKPTDAERRALQWLFVGLSFGLLGYTLAREHIMPLYWDIWFLRWTVNPIARAHGVARAMLPFSILGRYAGLLIFPWRLSPDYGANVTRYLLDWRDGFLCFGMAAAAAWVVGVLFALRRRAAAVLSCLLCAAAAYALISNTFMIIGTVMGERLIYLASVFVIVLASIGFAKLPQCFAVPLAIVLLSLASWRTATYAWRWNDAFRLFAMSRAEHPQSVVLYTLEANELMRRGRLDEAAAVLAVGRTVEPESANVWQMSAAVAEKQGDAASASRFGVIAMDLALNPPHMPRKPAAARPAAR